MTQLRAIAYVSTATPQVTTASLEALLLRARELNLASGVTGVLLCSDGDFMQCFEGEPRAVDETWRRILRSAGHRDVRELMNDDVGFRTFADWQMGFARATDSELLTLSTARWEATAGLSSSGAALGFELLQQFWRNAQRRP